MELTKEQIDQVFNEAEKQSDYIVGLYRKVMPDFDQKEDIPWPKCGLSIHNYIFSKAIEFDEKNHPGILPGGAWMNYGFSYSEDMNDWEVKE